ncbi:MAG: P1 family peptidase [Gemmatimonadetes bacterium]|nr:P1 family peptidase [Gemmatimonadota bacterium]
MVSFPRAVSAVTSLSLCVAGAPSAAQQRQTARQLGVVVGVLPPGSLNAITDVSGVLVGQVTVRSGDSINTGVTVVLPHGGNLFRDKVPGAVVVGNGFGKLMGFTQVQELGELESPIVLTCTLCVPRAADATLTYLLSLLGNESVRSINVVVGETNDGTLNHIRARPITERDVLRAIEEARPGPVEQGSVGAGRGTIAFGFKGGIGTSSRHLPDRLGGWIVGVLVQTNYGGILQIAGAPVGIELGRYYLRDELAPDERREGGTGKREGLDSPDGSVMIVLATDAPLEHRNLTRLARRALAGLARTGSSMSNGSGDYVIAFSSVPVARLGSMPRMPNDAMSPLFQAAIEATEEAIYNSLFMATTVQGYRGTATALPLDSTLAILQRHGVLRQ